MARWRLLLDGPREDIEHIKRLFSRSEFQFDEFDQRNAISAPQLESCRSNEDVIGEGMKLLASINTALRISVASYKGFQLHGIIEERAGKVHRTLLVLPGEIILAGAGAIAFAGELGAPVRSREERLVSLMARSSEMEELAVGLNAQPISWGAMNTIYESAKGLMSEKKSMKERRADHTGLVARGWLTEDESNRFYNTAGYYRHGHPREGTPTMEYTEALLLTKRLFWNLVDQLEPK